MSHWPITRRRLLQVSACASLAGLSSRLRAAPPVARWAGAALGTAATADIVGLTAADAGQVFRSLERELERLENIFSLHRPSSALAQLNIGGTLGAPPAELLEVLSLSLSVWLASGGAFDPTLQPLWRARHTSAPLPARAGSFADVAFSASRITLGQSGMALTLNGIAQGHITDRLAAVLQGFGLRNVLVNAGEVKALGRAPHGGQWRAGIAAPQGDVRAALRLGDQAVATSAPEALLLPGGGGHILDGRTGGPARGCRLASVLHPRADVADALSTACCCLTEAETASMLRRFDGARLVMRA